MNRRLLWSALSLAAVIAVAGCGGGSTTPHPKATATPTASPTGTPTTTPSNVPAATWAFAGSTGTTTISTSATPAAVDLAAYQGVTVSVQFAASASGAGALNFSDALNGADGAAAPDVTPNTLPADNATAGASPVVYLSLYNNTVTTMNFGSTPAITVSAALLGADTTCELDAYSQNGGSSATWMATGVTATEAANSVTLPATPLSGNNKVQLSPGQTVVAVACQ